VQIKTVDLKMLDYSGRADQTRPSDDLNNKDDAKLRDASKKLEGQFLTFMLKAMENTVPKDKEKDKQNLGSMMFSKVMGEEIANNGGIGLADFLYESLKANGGSPALNIQNLGFNLQDIDFSLPEVGNGD